MDLSYTHGASAQPLLGDTIGENLRQTALRHPDAEALVVAHQRYRATYRQLWDDTGRAARALMARGIHKGDRVGIWSPSRYEWVITQYATARIGAILVNINPSYQTAELEYALKQSGIRLIIMAPGNKGADYTAILAAVRDRLPALTEAVVLDADWDGLLSAADSVTETDLRARELQQFADDPINIQYTSGTTGFPKGATLSHHNILNNGYFVGEALHYGPTDRVSVPVPFYHCFGMVMGNLACTSHGACIVVPSDNFDALATLRVTSEERCTSLYGVPTMFIAQLDHPDFTRFDLSALRTGVMAGSPCPIEVMKKVQSLMHMKEVSICYGMTETSPVSTQTAATDPLEQRVATVGRVHPHVEIKVIDPESGAVVPRGTAGELCTRGYSVMLGYWENEAATRASIDPARWMHTGDLATMDASGYLNIVGRIKDMIIRGGENIYPRELEEFLYTHDAISDVQVIGVPSEKYGEEIMAWVKLRPGQPVTPEELTAFCTGKIARYKIPRYWKLTESWPMTISGKVQKYKMREQAIEELGLQSAAAVKTA